MDPLSLLLQAITAVSTAAVAIAKVRQVELEGMTQPQRELDAQQRLDFWEPAHRMQVAFARLLEQHVPPQLKESPDHGSTHQTT